MLDQRQLTRFRNKAQAAAALHHHNIVPVFSVGSERGVHYYAMQLIRGESLAAVIDTMTGDSASLSTGRAGRGAPHETIDCAADATSHSQLTPHPSILSFARSTSSRAYFRNVAELGIQAAESARLRPRARRHSPRHQAGQFDVG